MNVYTSVLNRMSCLRLCPTRQSFAYSRFWVWQRTEFAVIKILMLTTGWRGLYQTRLREDSYVWLVLNTSLLFTEVEIWILSLVILWTTSLHVHPFNLYQKIFQCLAWKINVYCKAHGSIFFNLLKTERRPLYLKALSVPRCKHFSSRL
jgi:hypothetical protein